MSFDIERIKANSGKIVLFEIDLPVIANYIINYSAGIWLINLNPNLGPSGTVETDGDGASGFWELPIAENPTYKQIGSLTVDNEYYTKTTSIALCDSTDKSFYYDTTNFFLYIHFENYDWPLKTVRIGVVNGFCDRMDTTYRGYYNNIYYDPRVRSVPSLAKRKDILFFGILQYSGGSVSLDNIDGYFDDYKSEYIFGQPVRIYLGYDGLAYSNFRQIYSGQIESFKISRNSIDFSIQDTRKLFSRKIPTNYFNQANYPYLSDDLVNAVKPVGWGYLKNAPLICVNSEITGIAGTVYQFYMCDTTYNALSTIYAVYIDGIATTSYTLSDNIISIVFGTAITYPSGDTDTIENLLDSVTATYNANTIAQGGWIIEDIISNYLLIPWNSSNYDYIVYSDTINTNSAENRNIGIYINEETEINKIIEQICVSEDSIFLIKDDGKFTYRKFDVDNPVMRTIQTDEWMNEPSFNFKSDEYLSSIKIGWLKDWNENIYNYYRNDTYERDAFEKYKKYSEKTIETLLTFQGGAAAKSESVILQSKNIVPTITRKTKMQNVDLEVMDFIIAEHDRESESNKMWNLYEITSINKNLNNQEIDFELREIADSYYIVDEYGNFVVDEYINYLIGISYV